MSDNVIGIYILYYNHTRHFGKIVSFCCHFVFVIYQSTSTFFLLPSEQMISPGG